MNTPFLRRAAGYGWAIVAVAAALGLRILLHPQLGDNRPFLTFLAAVAVAASLGGRGPAIFAIVLSYWIANYFLIPPIASVNFDHTSANDWVNLLIFVGLSLAIAEPILAMQRARQKAEAYALKIEHLLAEAQEADRQKDRFLAMLAHELRNPLTPLNNVVHLWPRMTSNLVEAERLRGVVSRQVNVLSRLVDDLMDTARYARGAIRLRKENVNLVAVVENAIESIGPKINERGHQLHVTLPDQPVFVDGDVVRLNQIVLNILDNAIKYTPREGAISVVVRRTGSNAVVQIRDNGPGIPRAMLASIFEMFSQVKATLEHSAGGLGIGLYLVKQLVELHGGQVEAHSDGPGTGSEFVVTLPAVATRTLTGDITQPLRAAS